VKIKSKATQTKFKKLIRRTCPDGHGSGGAGDFSIGLSYIIPMKMDKISISHFYFPWVVTQVRH
jgi:hypothetical protein